MGHHHAQEKELGGEGGGTGGFGGAGGIGDGGGEGEGGAGGDGDGGVVGCTAGDAANMWFKAGTEARALVPSPASSHQPLSSGCTLSPL